MPDLLRIACTRCGHEGPHLVIERVGDERRGEVTYVVECTGCHHEDEITAETAESVTSPAADTPEIAMIRRHLGDKTAELCALADDYLARGPRFQAAVREEVRKGLAAVFAELLGTMDVSLSCPVVSNVLTQQT